MPVGIATIARRLRSFFVTKLGNNTVGGDFLPSADTTYDLGGIGARWRNGHFDQLSADTLTVRQIQNLAIRPNLLRNGGFEEMDRRRVNQPIGWMGQDEGISLGPLFSILDDTTYPVGTVAASSLSLNGVETT